MKKLPISREQALELLKKWPQAKSDFNHYFMSEAIMKKLAEKLGEDEDYWAMLGLLHDVDWALTKNNWKEHCIKAAGILKTKGFDDTFIENVQSHGYCYEKIPLLKGKKRNSKIQNSLTAAENLTGIIYAYALMRGKKISEMEAKGLKKKFNDKSFAANCNRELVKEIELTGLPLDGFFALAIESIKKIKDQIGLN